MRYLHVLLVSAAVWIAGCQSPGSGGGGVSTNSVTNPPNVVTVVTNWQDIAAYTNNLVSPTNKPPVD